MRTICPPNASARRSTTSSLIPSRALPFSVGTPPTAAYRVKQDELVEFPYGYHTTVTTPGYQTYFLWLMAGDYQGFNRSNDPAHDWIK